MSGRNFDDELGKRDLVIGVVGLGFTGLPLALAFAEAGWKTIGFDIDSTKIGALERHRPYIPDVSAGELAALAARLSVTGNPSDLKDADVFIVCVPTPVQTDRTADLSFVEAAIDTIATVMRPGSLVVVQSTVPPGTTAKLAVRLAQCVGLTAGVGFHMAMAPERVDPASTNGWNPRNTPKLVGGLTPECGRRAVRLLSQIVQTVIPVSNPETAETAKVFENAFRMVNIALTYELADVCRGLGIAPREVIDAAASKPYSFMAHYPGPGVGGECIPVDPLFLLSIQRTNGSAMPLVDTAYMHIQDRPRQVVDRLAELLREAGSDLSGSRVLIAGVTYKPGVPDTRNAPALAIVRELRTRSAKPRYTDPFVANLVVDGEQVERVDWGRAAVADHDCVLLITPHEHLMSRPLWYAAPLVLDTWHLLPAGDGVYHL